MKKILRSDFAQSVVSATIVAYCAVCRWTSRLEYNGLEHAADYWNRGEPVVLSIWHGRLLLMPYLFKGVNKRPYALISDHRDGQLISKSAGWHNVHTVRGSTSKGGARALKEMLRLARDKHSIFITPDGPRGPRMVATSGVIDIARMSGLPIVPCTISMSRGRFTRSWDRFLVPFPFGRIHFLFGPPIEVPREIDKQSKADLLLQLEAEMIRIQNEADKLAGRHQKIEPDDGKQARSRVQKPAT